MRVPAVPAMLISLLAAPLLYADIDPLLTLDRMAQSSRTLAYSGTFTYQQGQQLSSMRIVHAVVDGKENERVLHLDGDQREILRHDHDLNCVHIGNRILRLGSDTSGIDQAASTARPLGLAAYYAVVHEGQERIAGRTGSRLRLSPRDPYRYGMTLVVDDATALLLKSETNDEAGRVLERFQFVDVHIGAVDAAELAAESPNPRILNAHADVQPTADAASVGFGWSVSWLPEGFALAASESRAGDARGTPVEMQQFTDGLAVFSVFVEPDDTAATTRAGHASQGATVAYITARGERHIVTVVGEIPIATAQLVANAVNFPPADL